MKAVAQLHAVYFVARRLQFGGKLRDTRRVCSGRESSVEVTAQAHHVAAFELRRIAHVYERPEWRKRSCEAGAFSAPAFTAHCGDYGYFVEDDGGIFHEDRVGMRIERRQGNHAHAEIGKTAFVRLMF